MAKSRKLSKEKGVLMVADLLHAGKVRKEILQIIATDYDISPKTYDNWAKIARPIVDNRLKDDEAIRRRESEAIVIDAVKRHGITKERVLERLAQIAFGNVKTVFTVDGGLKQISDWDDDTAGMVAGLETFEECSRDGESLGTNRKVKLLNPLDAICELNKMLGYHVPTKTAQTDTAGNDKEFNITLNIS